MCGLQDSYHVGTHKETSTNRRKRDEEDILKLLLITSELMTNPFSLNEVDSDGKEPLPLTNIATGVVMPADIVKRILQSYVLGTVHMNAFVSQRLDTNEMNFWNAIPNLQIKTFAALAKKKKKVKAADEKIISVSADRDLYGHLVISAKSRDINLKEVLSYELSTVPFSLAHSDGSLRKTTKSVLLTEMEKKVSMQVKLPAPGRGISMAYMIDAMASVQMIQAGSAATFGKLASKHYSLITAHLGQNGCRRVDVIFDQYYMMSI